MSPPSTLTVRNLQRRQKLDVGRLRKLLRELLREVLGQRSYELGVYFVNAAEITRLNESFLRHKGVTDVIAFEYSAAGEARLWGEIFVCVDEAMVQAARYRTAWQSELVRYVIHGVLHLCGYDERRRPEREGMKHAEDRLCRRFEALERFYTLRPNGKWQMANPPSSDFGATSGKWCKCSGS